MKFNDITEITSIIDHTLIKPDATLNDIEKICNEAMEYNFYSVCVNTWWAAKVKEILRHSKVKICATIGFPFGMTFIKRQEAINATLVGVDEIDMVMAIGAFKSRFFTDVQMDIEGVVDLDLPVKVIIETSFLTNEEIKEACKICIDAGASFIKTNTGFFEKKADENTVKLIKDEVKNRIGIKASGGIDNLDKFTKMVEAGATRIGTSHSVNIIKEFLKNN